MTHEMSGDDLARLDARLVAIEEEFKKAAEDSDHADELKNEQSRLLARRNELEDEYAGEGIAEEMIKSEAANADEIPRLPSEKDSEDD